MATQKSIARRQVAFQEDITAQMGETSSVLEKLLKDLAELKEEVHNINLAVLRVERNLKGGKDEG